MAIAFGHKDKGWRSRYSFTPKAVVGFNKELYSSSGTSVHSHNTGANNSFYGTITNSGISVAFNDNLSANKIFKTVSIEGTESLESDTTGSVFYPYNTTDSSTYYKPTSLQPMKVKGGILYGGLGRDNTLINGATMHYVGQVMKVSPLQSVVRFFPGLEFDGIPPEWIAFHVDTTGSDYVPEPGVKYGLYYNNQFYFGEGSSGVPTYQPFDSIEKYEDVPSQLTLPHGYPLLSRSEPIKDPYTFAYPALHSTGYLINNPINPTAIEGGVSLFAFKDPSVHGGDLRGQRAEMFINLGSDDFELYSVNLNYEPVSADHTK